MTFIVVPSKDELALQSMTGMFMSKCVNSKFLKSYYQGLVIIMIIENDACSSSLMDSIASPKVKITKGEEVWVRSLTHNNLGVEGRARALRWVLRILSGKSIIHTDLHKLNNKLVGA